MSLFQRMPQTGDNQQFYSSNLSKSKLLVGLGNPGAEYDGTRHNIGFDSLDKFVADQAEFDAWMIKKDLKCLLTAARFGDTRVIAIKPTTFMNLSGEAVVAAAHFYKIALADIVVIHDELDVPFGQIRLRTGGSSAGHNGLKSIMQHLDEGFGRIRIGIGPKTPEQIDSANFVLQKFSSEEQAQMPNLYKEVGAILSEYAYGASLPTDTRNFLI